MISLRIIGLLMFHVLEVEKKLDLCPGDLAVDSTRQKLPVASQGRFAKG